MLKVIKYESQYCWGSDGSYIAAIVFNTKTKKILNILQWGGYIDKKGNYHPSKYAFQDDYKTYKDALEEMYLRCRR